MKISLFIYFFLIAICSILAQSIIDSLTQLVKTAKHDTVRCQIILELGDLYENQIPYSAIYYYQQSEQISWKNILILKN